MESRFFAFYQVSAHDIVTRAEAARSAKAGKTGHGAPTGGNIGNIGNISGGGIGPGSNHGTNKKQYVGAVGERGASDDGALFEKGGK
ncbi:hypothetical protein CMQ_8058 [Grosmannia clavigera kw1407]|uniref:Uncharacterized protein n=1 Tax=Grosmannia clavigera (strain kw1407 / UAMH 11150) TaxID=655863 RepID=F0XKI5_GROCL|nr:uncharacterized protein CMQ_8058 [Grosmannia clavigera kw1407]EFX01592.1 hypothetical protein CMQ_8058 [Grosmannia clavigera kw1407]